MLIRRSTRPLLAAILTLLGSADAATLGEARVKSFLNQPLEVEIDLVGLGPGEHEGLRLRVANQQHFDRLGIVYDNFLAQLQFDVAQVDGRWVVRARSTQPVTEPFIDFPLQMSWPGGQMIRQYTLLLDPVRRIERATAASLTPTGVAPSRVPQEQVRTPASALPASYGPVRPGETLWPIAQKLRPQGITTQQMAMALLRANPQAFVNNDINRLRAGATLSIPPLALIEELDAAAARAEFDAQARRPRALPALATSPRPVQAGAGVAGEPTGAQDASPTAAPPAQAEPKLRIVAEPAKSDAVPADEQALQEQLLVTMEEIESNRIATGAIESRLARLEEELQRMQRLLELKDAQIEALQTEVADRSGAADTATAGPAAPADDAAADAGRGDFAMSGAASSPPAGGEPSSAPVMRLEQIAPAVPQATPEPWYQRYLWLPWALLGLLGIGLAWLLLRRPTTAASDADSGVLPRLEPYDGPAGRAEALHSAAALRRAEADLPVLDEPAEDTLARHATAPQRVPSEPAAALATGSGPAVGLDDDNAAQAKSLGRKPGPAPLDSDISDDDIASWVAELDAEADRLDVRSANDAEIALDEDIPGILHELDDRIATAAQAEVAAKPAIQLEPLDEEPDEDDTFAMSLDLARAYLEIGDQEGAKDMLQQALAGTRDPGHRRQIEELLQQID
jgi:FimV-like protein